ncbi:MAG: hypothetical protein LPK19_02615, partial [Hymenobacteraceae bacterium]|nr:hypothetical protein [Hymenobacteraceae bacterium]MDX5511113.1 hypothetical protein [Hymenobacteraceae bacterium]
MENRNRRKFSVIKKRIARRLLPFFAPVMLSPLSIPLNKKPVKANDRSQENRLATLKVMDFENVT